MPKHYIVSRGSFNQSLGVYRPVLDNILTFEVEDRFHVDNPEIELSDSRSRIIPLIMHLLDLLDDQKARATFFILGWVARKFPEVVALIDSRGNEVASHGFTHSDVRKLPLDDFRRELTRSKEILEDITGKPVYGYKAASPYLGKDHLALYRVLAEVGYRYDCSLSADGPRMDRLKPFPIPVDQSRSIIAIPQSSRRKWGVPMRFGENLRILPSWFGLRSIKDLNDKGYPAMINMKLWELDAHHPRSAGLEYVKYSQFGNLNLAEEKLYRMLEIFRFTNCADILKLSQQTLDIQ